MRGAAQVPIHALIAAEKHKGQSALRPVQPHTNGSADAAMEPENEGEALDKASMTR